MFKQYYDLKTTNKSFIKMHEYLKKNNIKNNKFMLLLYNKDLVGVDPYDPNLSPSLKLDIIKECAINIWYYLRELVRIPMPGGGDVPFTLDQSNMAQTFTALFSISSWLTKPRELHKSVSTLAIINHQRIFREFIYNNDELSIRLCSKNRNMERNLKWKLKYLTNCLPDYIQHIAVYKDKNVNSETPMGKSKFIYKAEDIGRAFSDSIIYYNEAEFIANINTVYNASLLPFKKRQINLLQSTRNEHKTELITAMLFESVISDNTTATKIIDKAIKWEDEYYDLNQDELIELVKTSNGIFHIYTTYEDLGLGENWYREQCMMLDNDWNYIRREVLLKRKNEMNV